jgi:hypothetical protein
MDSFKDFFNRTFDKAISGSGDLPKTRIQRGIVGIGRLNQRLVPDIHRPDMSLNPKVEALRNNNVKGIAVLNDNDVADITSTYNIKNLTPNSPRELGTTDIVIFFDKSKNSYCLKKGNKNG